MKKRDQLSLPGTNLPTDPGKVPHFMDQLFANTVVQMNAEGKLRGLQQQQPSDPAPPLQSFPPTGTLCSVCQEPQYLVPGGAVCVNQHGGADPLMPDAPLWHLHLEVREFPPSTNHLYFTDWSHKRTHVLKKDGVLFQNRFIAAVNSYLADLQRFLQPGDIYSVVYSVFFPHDEIVSRTYGEKGGAQERYKRVDAENRCKIISDSLAKALGLDDKLFFSTRIDKKSARLVGDVAQVHIDIMRTDPAFFGV